MKKIDLRRKQWLDDRSRRMQQKKHHNKRISAPYAQVNPNLFHRQNEARQSNAPVSTHSRYVAVAPEIFSFTLNPVDTIAFFNAFAAETRKNIFDRNFFFDVSRVKTLTSDAIMYILAIIRNSKYNVFRYTFAGNAPADKTANQAFKESGFYDYVRAESKTVPSSCNAKICIKTGKQAEPDIAADICDFVNNKLGTGMPRTRILYNLLIELMTNTRQHAYSVPNIAVNNWYVYVECTDDRICVTFLDTGMGIPNTVHKKFGERYVPGYKKSDSAYISSALNGEFRTKTKQMHRGKGLPLASNYAQSENVRNFQIMSGKGRCRIEENTLVRNQFIQTDFDQAIQGTLFSWEIRYAEGDTYDSR